MQERRQIAFNSSSPANMLRAAVCLDNMTEEEGEMESMQANWK